MRSGEKEIDIKDIVDTVNCTKRVIEHIRKIEEAEIEILNKNKSKPQAPIKLSDQEKCFRTSFVKVVLFTLCFMGLGKQICESYDKIKDKEKKSGLKLTDNEVYQIIMETVE